MEWDFADKHLLELYEKGRSKKYKFIDRSLAKKFVERVGRIEASVNIYDLREPPSMKFESLEGYSNRFSIRLDRQCRLEFEIDFNNEEKTAGVVRILTVSKHYE
jgi:plasmid maintenance system killer protein